jgi:hypothetical protein
MKRRFSNVRKMRKMRGFLYHGFRIFIFNNHYYSFRYEWQINPVSSTSKRLLMRNGINKQINDPTSMPTSKPTVYYAKMQVRELKNPFWNHRFKN